MRDRWAREISTELVFDHGRPSYNRILYYKQMDKNGGCEFRDLYIPGPNEIVAETALLGECANITEVFQPRHGVYSYRLSSGAETKGVYKYYFYGFLDRHQAIARACDENPDSEVIYTDIRGFYPSVSLERARNVWSSACFEGKLPDRSRDLGMKLLENQACTTGNSGSGLLIGPMFSHLIGNLVLRDIDSRMAAIAPGRYFRYVDDFVIVAPKKEAYELENKLKDMLNKIELEIHEEKRMPVCAQRWLEVADFFEDEESPVSWKTFIGQLKQLMLFRPDSRLEMEDKLRNAEIRVRPKDYSEVRQDSDFLSRAKTLVENSWFTLRMHNLGPNRIIQEGFQLRSRYMRQLFETLQYMESSDSLGRKMSISRIRYLLSRLAYLATPPQLLEIANSIANIDEVRIFEAILRALENRDVSDLLRFGSIAVKSVAPSLLLDPRPVRCSISELSEEASQALAVLLLYGVPLEISGELPEDPMTQFCRGGHGISEIYESPDMYFRELACLHGLDEPDVLRWCMETAFDRDEEMASDMMDIVDMSYWG